MPDLLPQLSPPPMLSLPPSPPTLRLNLRIAIAPALLGIAMLLTAARPACAQLGGPVPSTAYNASFNMLYNGNYKQALNQFGGALQGGIKTTHSRWIDSIAYYTMVGECHLRLGNNAAALENYNAALRIYVQGSDGMLRVQFPAGVQATNLAVGSTAPWGKSTRGSKPASYPGTMSVAVGTQNVENTVRTGGIVAPPVLYPVCVQEIVRTTCLAMKRRRELLGPVAQYDPLTDEVLNAAGLRRGPPNHWSEAWLDVQQGFAYSAAGRSGQAVALLKRSLLVLGQYDHPITSLALLELGDLALEAGDAKAAAGFFEEATYAAVNFPDSNVLEESFRQLFLAHLLGGSLATLDTPLATAMTWSRSRNAEIRASLALIAAESLALRGQTPKAISVLSDAKAFIGRSDMLAAGIGSRWNYLTAMTSYQRGVIDAGDAALAASLEYQKNSARWLFHISLADNLYINNTGGRFSPRVAMTLFERLLRDPTASDWNLRPLESLAVLSTPHFGPYERWFDAALQQAPEDALEVADMARRHRFHSTLHTGGRLLALRWVLESPEEMLDSAAKLQRQELLTRYPVYAEASRQAKQLRAGMTAQGLRADTPETQREFAAKLAELAALATKQEVVLREMAVRREPADMVFPPVRKTKDVQKDLQPGQLLLAFFSTTRGTFGWLFSDEKYALWKIENGPLVEKKLVGLLRGMGNFDATRELQETQLADNGWQKDAKELLDAIFLNSKVTLNAEYEELIIVPDGSLWYVPFEALPVGDPKTYESLLSKVRIRYAPTVGLAFPMRQGRKTEYDIGVALGKMYPTEAPETVEASFEQIRRAVPRAVALRAPLPAASPLVGGLFDGLIVLDDIAEGKSPFDWSPLPLDKARAAGSVNMWLALPWKNPDQFILPGFHTAAENGLKSPPALAGSELFLTTTALMATGARTVLISRWRTGGQTAVDLTREFAQEIPFGTAADAWQRAVQLVSESPLDPQREPRVRRAPNAATLNASHPFFWAGYLLCDPGAAPVKDAPPPEKPMLKLEEK